MQRSVGVAAPPRKVWSCSHAVRGFMGLGLAFVMGGSPVSAQTYFDVLGSIHGPGGSALMRAADGTLYGTTATGGQFGRGTIFRMPPAGGMVVLHDFAGGTDGWWPQAPLIQAADGNFYGTTNSGGSAGRGTVFRMTPGWVVTVMHAFVGGHDGASPDAALVQATDGNFYGTTDRGGGMCDCGTIFKMTPGGVLTVLYQFGSRSFDGYSPRAAMIQATDGNFYGTTYSSDIGATSLEGTIFRMTPAGDVAILHQFAWQTEGGGLSAPLIQSLDGYFYGTTEFGGPYNSGTVFKMAPDGTFTLLHAFMWQTDGGLPIRAALTQTTDGNIYGTTRLGGTFGQGTVFQLNSSGAVIVLHSLTAAEGNGPYTLVEADDGSLYGTTESSSTGSGTIFRVGATPLVNRSFTADFDGDGRSDLVVYRPTTGVWYVRTSSTGYSYANATSYQWGIAGDIPIAADFDGDHKTDLAVYRPTTGEWFVRASSTGYAVWTSYQWGIAGDVPLVADFDGDGKSDLTIWRPSTGEWYVRFSTTRYASWAVYQWGVAGDIPLVADFDGRRENRSRCVASEQAVWYVRLFVERLRHLDVVSMGHCW